MRLGSYDSAQKAFQYALDFGIRDPRFVRGFVYAYERVNGVSRAVSHYQVLCQRKPDRADLWYGLCLTYWGKK